MGIFVCIRATGSSVLDRVFDKVEGKFLLMLDGTPAEEDLVCLDIDLVDNTVLHPAILGPTDRRQISLGNIDGCDEHGPIFRDSTLMDVDI